MKVLIVRSSGETPRFTEHYNSVDRLVTPPGTETLPVGSSSPAKNRNIAIKAALEAGNYTHIFFVDDDQVFHPDTLMRLLSHNVDIVSGMYCMKVEPFPIIALNRVANNMNSFIDMNQYPPNQLIVCDRVPAGCLLVTTKALIDMIPFLDQTNNYYGGEFNPKYVNKWFTLGQIIPDEWGDDLWFCDRAIDTGYNIYLDTGVPVGHLTKVALWPTWNPELNKWEIRFSINEGLKIPTGE